MRSGDRRFRGADIRAAQAATAATVARLAPRETAALLLNESDALVAEAGRTLGVRANADLPQMLRRLRHDPDGLGMDRATARG